MRAIRFDAYGDPSRLQVDDGAPEPEASAGTVRIAVLAAAVNPIDWKLRRGDLRGAIDTPLPVIPGRDAVGIVDQLGDGVDDVELGDLVFGNGGLGGGYAEHMVLTAWAMVPAAWSIEQASAAALAATTALNAVSAIEPLGAGPILVSGAAGAVGSAASAFAVAAGAVVIGTARQENHPYLTALGVIPVEYGPGLADRVAAAAPDGVAAAIDTVGGGSLDELVRIVGRADRVVTVTDPQGASRLGTGMANGENDAALLRRAAEAGERGQYVPRIARVLPLAEAHEAHRLAELGGVDGKLVLRVGAGDPRR